VEQRIGVHGLTAVTQNTENGLFNIYHYGNMGDTVKGIVTTNVKHILGVNILNESTVKVVEAHGSPDYEYVAKIRLLPV
jgi:hypothetical protein